MNKPSPSQATTPPDTPAQQDPWAELRRFTAARLALGRSGVSLPTREVLGFGLSHAMARDAVHLPLDMEAIARGLTQLGLEPIEVHSQAPDRHTYLLRPDLGRRLSADDDKRLRQRRSPCDLLLVVGDGLSAMAIERHALPLIEAIVAARPASVRLGPVVLAHQARVALGDAIGEALQMPMVAMLIGERPGLSAPDSLGIYLTHAPRTGRMDSERNCISNVRPEGLGHADAARKLWWLVNAATRLGQTGVALKDDGPPALPD